MTGSEGDRGALVSVIVPAFNAERFIETTLQSALAQTYRPLEIIVVDDGSTDGTVARIAGLGDRVTVLRNPNAGVAAARNDGARRAGGAFLAFLDADDVWEPTKIERQMAVMACHPEVGVVATAFDEIDEHGARLSRPIKWDGRIAGRVVRLHRYLLTCGNPVALSTALVRRSAFEEVGGFYSRERILSADYELWIRLSERHTFYVLSDVLCHYRVLAQSMIHGSLAKEYGAQLRILGMHRHRFSGRAFRSRESRVFRDWADSALFEGNADGWPMWRASLRKNPLNVGAWVLGARAALSWLLRRLRRLGAARGAQAR